MAFFGDDILLGSSQAKRLYQTIRDLPVIDYHCHLDEKMIANDEHFSDIGELWLAHDHYKWRAMRASGISEDYITGDRCFKDKFKAYASIMPKLAGNPLYYWSHFELKWLFGVFEPLSIENADAIFEKSRVVLTNLGVREMLRRFNVELIGTTDDPVSSLAYHGKYDNVNVIPTFRTDKACMPTSDYVNKLGLSCGEKIKTLADYERALKTRLGHFKDKGCRASDCSVDFLSAGYVERDEAERIFVNADGATSSEKKMLASYLATFLASQYSNNSIVMQLHLGATRNVNGKMFERLGCDAGYDVISGNIDIDALGAFLNRLNSADSLPRTILYSLDETVVKSLFVLAGSFPNVYVGAAWWFNDTLEGIKRHLSYASEYSVLGTNVGMLTDSRSFTGYCRFDFFRRILADHVGKLVERGEFDERSAENLVKDICYNNPKALFE